MHLPRSGSWPRISIFELAARTIRDLGEDAGRLVLTDPDRFSPDRFERFVKNVLCLLVTGHGAETAASSGAESA